MILFQHYNRLSFSSIYEMDQFKSEEITILDNDDRQYAL